MVRRTQRVDRAAWLIFAIFLFLKSLNASEHSSLLGAYSIVSASLFEDDNDDVSNNYRTLSVNGPLSSFSQRLQTEDVSIRVEPFLSQSDSQIRSEQRGGYKRYCKEMFSRFYHWYCNEPVSLCCSTKRTYTCCCHTAVCTGFIVLLGVTYIILKFGPKNFDNDGSGSGSGD